MRRIRPYSTYIVRDDYKSTKGWVFKCAKHNLPSKLFSDGVYGSWRAAARAAIAHRNSLLPVELRRKSSLYSYLLDNDRFYHKELSSRNVSGIVGVAIHTRGNLVNIVGTYYKNKYEPERKSFAVLKYGLDKALELAIEFRDKGVVDIERQKVEERAV
jgi:hypothetical protein